MSKQLLGKIIALLGALTMIINVTFFKQTEWYDPVRWISFAAFMLGILLLPTYSKSNGNN